MLKKAELCGGSRNRGKKAQNYPRTTEALITKKKKLIFTSQPYTVEQKCLKIQSFKRFKSDYKL